ncbi:hypothetical protein AVEN_164544-1 [Araneus ventricosus]|uniref:Uncharacterized protein n=1 Tax=Araneus ventricosus TaxID=182803 RepID=A0A4Y2B2F6_ARAVE|nr:hypothetical protein AVEN_164544-1 [Araneus ventricosus]
MACGNFPICFSLPFWGNACVLNPIEYLWDYLGRQVAALSPPPRLLDELEQGLLLVWSSLAISVSGNLIDSMESRCRYCIQVRGGHIPY